MMMILPEFPHSQPGKRSSIKTFLELLKKFYKCLELERVNVMLACVCNKTFVREIHVRYSRHWNSKKKIRLTKNSLIEAFVIRGITLSNINEFINEKCTFEILNFSDNAFDIFFQCTATCGNKGFQTRGIQCVWHGAQEPAPSSACKRNMPRTSIPCGRVPCQDGMISILKP